MNFYLIQSICGEWSRVSSLDEKIKEAFSDGLLETILQINQDGTSFKAALSYNYTGTKTIVFEAIIEIEVPDELNFSEV